MKERIMNDLKNAMKAQDKEIAAKNKTNFLNIIKSISSLIKLDKTCLI